MESKAMVEQMEQDRLRRGAEPMTETFLEEKDPKVTCVYCGDSMDRDQVPRFSRFFGIGLLVLGLAVSAVVSLVVGLPLVVIGAYMGSAVRSVWLCRVCSAMVDRDGN